MLRPLAPLAILVVLTACGPQSGERATFDRVGRGDDPGASIEGTPPGTGSGDGEDAGEESTPTPPGDDADADDTWDAAEPDVSNGSVVTFAIQCGLLDGEPVKRWMKVGASWEELRPEDGEAQVQAWQDLEPCFSGGGKSLEWGADGRIYIEAGGMGHDTEPTETEGRWFGAVRPLGSTTSECDAALAARGMSWPVAVGLSLISVTPPT